MKYKLNLPMPGYANSRGNRGGSLRLRWILRKWKSGFGGGAEFGKGEGEAEIGKKRYLGRSNKKGKKIQTEVNGND